LFVVKSKAPNPDSGIQVEGGSPSDVRPVDELRSSRSGPNGLKAKREEKDMMKSLVFASNLKPQALNQGILASRQESRWSIPERSA
jgi:hypothetical protein